jgi:hypothetical protein
MRMKKATLGGLLHRFCPQKSLHNDQTLACQSGYFLRNKKELFKLSSPALKILPTTTPREEWFILKFL